MLYNLKDTHKQTCTYESARDSQYLDQFYFFWQCVDVSFGLKMHIELDCGDGGGVQNKWVYGTAAAAAAVVFCLILVFCWWFFFLKKEKNKPFGLVAHETLKNPVTFLLCKCNMCAVNWAVHICSAHFQWDLLVNRTVSAQTPLYRSKNYEIYQNYIRYLCAMYRMFWISANVTHNICVKQIFRHFICEQTNERRQQQQNSTKIAGKVTYCCFFHLDLEFLINSRS